MTPRTRQGRRWPGLLLASLLVAAVPGLGCPGGEAPALRVAGVTPAQGEDDSAVVLEIEGDGFLTRVHADFERPERSGHEQAFAVWLVPADGEGLDPLRLEGIERLSATRLRATVPAGPARGFYGVRIVDPRGREASLPEIYRVVRAASHVTAFRLEPIVAQRAGVPFLVQVSAVDLSGRVVDGFTGSVTLSDRSGALAPETLGPFALGRARGLVTVSAVTEANLVEARDPQDRSGVSNEFAVQPGRAARLAFAPAPLLLLAGACSAPIELQLLDSLGEPAPASAALHVGFALAPPDGAALFGDPACSEPIGAGLGWSAGEATGRLFARATRAGPLGLRAAAADLPSARLEGEVAALGPDRLSFASPSQVLGVGACSAPIAVELQDRYANPSPSAEPLRVRFESQPAESLVFFSDAACSVPLPASLELAAASPGTHLFALAAQAGAAAIRAAPEAPSTLAAGLLGLTVTP